MDIMTQMRALTDQVAEIESAPLSSAACTTVKVAHSIEEMMQAFAVRSAVFIGEQHCPYAEEFDGNDFTATHILGLIDEEPVASVRIRYFANFARLERMAVRPEFRNRAVAAGIIDFAFDLCRQKGYMKLHGQAEEHLIPFWEKFGWRRVDAPSFGYAGNRYVEIERDLERHPDPIAIGKDPMLFIRPEGAWNESCPVERLIRIAR